MSQHSQFKHYLMVSAHTLLVLPLIFTLNGCQENTESTATPAATPLISEQQTKAANAKIWQNAQTQTQKLTLQVQQLKTNIEKLIEAPSEDNLALARSTWLNATLATRPYFFTSQLSTVSGTVFQEQQKIYSRLNSYPIMPGFIDSYAEYEFSGIVNDISIPVDTENLIQQQGLTDSEEVVLGLHAIEYLLFGYKGLRSIEHFMPINQLSIQQKEQGFKSTDELANNRRRVLLSNQAKQALTDATELSNKWQSTSVAYKKWTSLPLKEQMQLVKQAYEKAVTQLLIEIVEISRPQKIEYDGFISPQINQLDTKQKQQWLKHAVQSLSLATPFLPKEYHALVQENSGKLISLLNTPNLETTEEASNQQDLNWEEIYRLTKNLIAPQQTSTNEK